MRITQLLLIILFALWGFSRYVKLAEHHHIRETSLVKEEVSLLNEVNAVSCTDTICSAVFLNGQQQLVELEYIVSGETVTQVK